MDYNKATLFAATGKDLLLPGWQGLFKWDYGKNQLYFQNGDYRLDSKQIVDIGLNKRNDWYYII